MKIRAKLMSMSAGPMFIVAIIIGLVAMFITKESMEVQQENLLKAAVIGYQGDVYAFQDLGIDLTVFEGDTRVESSIDGVIGTKASDVVIETVLNKHQTYFDTKVNVQGTPYYGYYMPTANGMLFAGKPQTVVQSNINSMMLAILGISALLLVLFSGPALLIAGSMAKKIRAVTANIGKIALGDLSVESGPAGKQGKDEIGEINDSTRNMAGKLFEMIKSALDISDSVNGFSGELSTTADTALSAMNEVSKAVEEIAVGLTGQNRAVQAIAGNITGITEDIGSIKESAEDIAVCSHSLDRSSTVMKQKMTEMSESSEKVNQSIEGSSEKIRAISRVIDGVKGIVAVIGDISSQTELLSLNASIEAARAGEAGRGFAVVADSISSLSKDISHQVEEITNIINTLVTDFDECIETINKAVTSGNEQKEDLNQTIEEFGKLTKEIEETATEVQAIRVAIDGAAVKISSISDEVNDLTEISETSAASTEEVNASVEEVNALMNGVATSANALNNKAEELNEKLSFFKV